MLPCRIFLASTVAPTTPHTISLKDSQRYDVGAMGELRIYDSDDDIVTIVADGKWDAIVFGDWQEKSDADKDAPDAT